MKRTLKLIIILVGLWACMGTADAQRYATVKDMMQLLEEKYDMKFVYDSELDVDVIYVGTKPDSGDMDKDLGKVFKDSGIDWKRNGRYVVLSKAQPRNINLDVEEMRDTIDASVVTDSRMLKKRSVGELSSDVEVIRAIVSPLGEGDAIRWAQSLPGVTTGADGSAAFYVRGSNMGNNLFSLDGVPIYGYTHMLGLTTVVPTSVINDATLTKGGFEATDNNFTSAHLRITTKRPDRGYNVSAALNNFLASVGGEANFNDKISFILSARVSPLTLEYKAMRGLLKSSMVSSISDMSARIGDVYGKFRWDMNENNALEVFGLGSIDRYDLSMSEDSRQVMGWHNGIGQLRYLNTGDNGDFTAAFSYNNYGSSQEEDKMFRGVRNQLSLKSDMSEITARIDRNKFMGKRQRFIFSFGAKYRHVVFKPGQVGALDNRNEANFMDAYIQLKYVIPEKLEIKANGRVNRFANAKDKPTAAGSALTVMKEKSRYIDPSGSLFAKWNISEAVAVEAGIDHLVQYYHTLEGLPVGWSTDMLVPSGSKVKPEYSDQASVAFTLDFSRHKASVGGFYKQMENLVYYKYSQTMFNGGFAAWEDDTEQGLGLSYGGEFLYEYIGKEFYARASYTLSKTNRSGFPSLYDGGEFHARFDRTHVLNALAQWKGFSAAFTLQSGHWENGEPVTYPMHILDDVEWTAKYYSGVNNFHMPMVLRLDLGWQHIFHTEKFTHDLNVGIYNVTNHFNPFALYFNAETERWMGISMLPIMPNFSYRITF